MYLARKQNLQQIVEVSLYSFAQDKSVISRKFASVLATPMNQIVGLGNNRQLFVLFPVDHLPLLNSVHMYM